MILVLTPLAVEEDALISALGAPLRTTSCAGHRLTHFEGGLASAVGGHGKVEFALTAFALAHALKPALLVCAGAAGSLGPETKTLDVVAATETIEHDFNLRFARRPLPRFAGHAPALARLRETSPTIRFGALASGDEDILEIDRARQVRDLTGALAVAWEGAGGARAARRAGVPFLELRLITDSADANAIADFQKNLKLGMPRLALALRALPGPKPGLSGLD